MFSYRPKPSVYSVSITGRRCELGCRHCRGVYLGGMEAAEDPESLFKAFLKAKRGGAKSLLISGGFDRKGRLPIFSFLEAIKKGKDRTGLLVEVHSGIIQEMEELGSAGVDAILLDLIGDQETIELYLGGEWSVNDYYVVMENAKSWIPTVAAHVLVGVNCGEIRGEFDAIDIAVRGKANALSILTLMGAEGRSDLKGIMEVMDYARERFRGHLTLGCMRGKGKDRIEIERGALKLGYDGIANPLRETLRIAESLGLPVEEVEGCCVFTPSKTPKSTKDQEGARQEGRPSILPGIWGL
ncbi:MAG: radical SAM protein [Candidatus Methanomethylicaceae archaeon]